MKLFFKIGVIDFFLLHLTTADGCKHWYKCNPHFLSIYMQDIHIENRIYQQSEEYTIKFNWDKFRINYLLFLYHLSSKGLKINIAETFLAGFTANIDIILPN